MEQEPTVWTTVKEVYERFVADDGLPLAGNIAFRTILSVFPFLIFLTALAGFIGNAELAREVVTFLLDSGPAELIEPLVPEIESILGQSAQRFSEPRRASDHLDRFGRSRQRAGGPQPGL